MFSTSACSLPMFNRLKEASVWLIVTDRPDDQPTNQPTNRRVWECQQKCLTIVWFPNKNQKNKNEIRSRVYPKLLLSHILHGIEIEQLFRHSLFSKIYTEMQKNSVSVQIRRYLNAFRHKEINDSRGLEIFLWTDQLTL